MSAPKMNKRLYTEIIRLKLLNKIDSQPRFIVDKSPFGEDDDDEEELPAASEKYIFIVGRIFPKSNIYNQGAYQIEIKLPPKYPFEPPEVRFITKIYHPNIHIDGSFCNELLDKFLKWTPMTSLVEVIKIVVKHVDQPDIDYSINIKMGQEYMNNKSEFDRKALEYIRKYALPRV